jgi:hypothetical protein
MAFVHNVPVALLFRDLGTAHTVPEIVRRWSALLPERDATALLTMLRRNEILIASTPEGCH